MAKKKASSNKKQSTKSRGVEFKKIKRKLGRKLPPPKNSTNTQIKSKAIVLPEQSVASDKTGLAVNKKGLTLKELLQQTSHHNAKIRKDALFGLKDLFCTHPLELKEHKYAVIEKLSERFVDEDKVIRDTLYQSFKSIILPACKEENQGPMVSLMIPYVFMAMTHLAIDIRMMAFKFLQIIVHFHPPSFFLHSEKILQKFEDVLKRSQLQEKSKLKNILNSLIGCLLLLPVNQNPKSHRNNVLERKLLHMYEDDDAKSCIDYSIIVGKIRTLLPILIDCFGISAPSSSSALDSQSFELVRSLLHSIKLTVSFLMNYTFKKNLRFGLFSQEYEKFLWYNEIAPVLFKKLFIAFPFCSNDEERYFLMNSDVVEIFLISNEHLDSPLPLLEEFFLFIEGVFLSNGKNIRGNHAASLISFIPNFILNLTEEWQHRLIQAFTFIFKESRPESFAKHACLKAMKEMLSPKDVLFTLSITNSSLMNQLVCCIRDLPDFLIHVQEKSPHLSKITLDVLLSFSQACAINPLLAQEYSSLQTSLQKFFSVSNFNGAFINSPKDVQEVAISCLSYFPNVDSFTLSSLASCCLSKNIDPLISTRIISAMESAHLSGRLCIANYVNFVVTIICRFSEDDCNYQLTKIITREICLSLSRIGDKSLLLPMVEKLAVPELDSITSLATKCAILRILNKLDSSPSNLSDQSVCALEAHLPGYLVNVIEWVGTEKNGVVGLQYYVAPCHTLFLNYSELFSSFIGSLERMGNIDGKMNDIVTALLMMCRDHQAMNVCEVSTKLCSLMDRLHGKNI